MNVAGQQDVATTTAAQNTHGAAWGGGGDGGEGLGQGVAWVCPLCHLREGPGGQGRTR
jgi:hypothetical protein